MPCKMVGRGGESDRIWSPFIIYDWNPCVGVKVGKGFDGVLQISGIVYMGGMEGGVIKGEGMSYRAEMSLN